MAYDFNMGTRIDLRSGQYSRWLWIALIWLSIGMFDASDTVFSMRAEGHHHAWLSLFITLLFSWLPWALATPLILELSRRYALELKPAVCIGDQGREEVFLGRSNRPLQKAEFDVVTVPLVDLEGFQPGRQVTRSRNAQTDHGHLDTGKLAMEKLAHREGSADSRLQPKPAPLPKTSLSRDRGHAPRIHREIAPRPGRRLRPLRWAKLPLAYALQETRYR